MTNDEKTFRKMRNPRKLQTEEYLEKKSTSPNRAAWVAYYQTADLVNVADEMKRTAQLISPEHSQNMARTVPHGTLVLALVEVATALAQLDKVYKMLLKDAGISD